MATFAKLKDGTWGVRVQGTAAVGQTVEVTKKDGTKENKTIAKVLWTGNGIALCSIADSGIRSRSSGHSSGGNVCGECGRGGRLVRDLEDGIMKHYGCCDIPPEGY